MQAMLCNKMSTEEMLSNDDQRRRLKHVGADMWSIYRWTVEQRQVDGLNLLLQQMVRVDKLAWCSHAGTWHHRYGLHATKALTHASWKVSVLRVRGGLLERAKLVLTLVLFLFAAIASVRTVRAIASLMCATMSEGQTVSAMRKEMNTET